MPRKRASVTARLSSTEENKRLRTAQWLAARLRSPFFFSPTAFYAR